MQFTRPYGQPVAVLSLLGAIASLAALLSPSAHSIAPEPTDSPLPFMTTRPIDSGDRAYASVIQRTVGMVSDPAIRRQVEQMGLNIVDVTWEDTGRYYNSAVGPNISDMTIQVQHRDPNTGEDRLSLMPVIRYPNFSDRTADIPLDQFYVLVGNERGEDLERVALRDLLGNLRQYLHEPESWAGRRDSLLANRDSHVLVSAQACFLPVPQGEIAQFNPVLFNYQSYAGDPAVLTILATREGTSITVIDNQRDGFSAGATWGQRLFFNQNGERASLTGQRMSDFVATQDTGDRDTPPLDPASAEAAGLNMVLLIQVPLKQHSQARSQLFAPSAPMAAESAEIARGSSVEEAVIGHGEVEGPFTEIDGLAIERDPRFPIRVTVQFYKATSDGILADADMEHIQQQIGRVYDDADYVGSLVVDGPSTRPTEYDGDHQQPDHWWEEFWQRYEANTGRSRVEALNLLEWLRGGDRPTQNE